MSNIKFKLKHKFIDENYNSITQVHITNDLLFKDIVIEFENNVFNTVCNENYLFSKNKIYSLIDLEKIELKTKLISSEYAKILIKEVFSKLYDNSELLVEYEDYLSKNDQKIINAISNKELVPITFNMDIKTSYIYKRNVFDIEDEYEDEDYDIDYISVTLNYDNLRCVTNIIPNIISKFKINVNKCSESDIRINILKRYKEYLFSHNESIIEDTFYNYIEPILRNLLFKELCKDFSKYVSKYILHNLKFFNEKRRSICVDTNYDIVMNPIKVDYLKYYYDIVMNPFEVDCLEYYYDKSYFKFKVSERSGIISDTEIFIKFNNTNYNISSMPSYTFLDNDIEEGVNNANIYSIFKNIDIASIKNELIDVLKSELEQGIIRVVLDANYYFSSPNSICSINDLNSEQLNVINEVIKDGGFIVYYNVHCDDNITNTANIHFNIKNPIISDFLSEYIDSEFVLRTSCKYDNIGELLEDDNINNFLYEKLYEVVEDGIGEFLLDHIVFI